MANVKFDQNGNRALAIQNSAGDTLLPATGVALADANPQHVAIVDGNGDQITNFGGYGTTATLVSGRASATDTTSTSLIAAPAASLRNYITQITVWNSSAVNTYIKIQDGSGGTEIYDVPAPAGGGATLSFPVPLKQPTTATALYFAANASANAIVISASGFKAA